MPAKTSTPLWRYRSLRSGYEHITPLTLFWELDGDPITDNYLPEEITALDLWHRWRREYRTDADAEAVFGKGAHRIWWYVDGGKTFEGAPFRDLRGVRYPGQDFLDSFTWPAHADSQELVRWSALPVRDKAWRKGRGDKGGFIQEVTGWKPSPMQAHVNIDLLAAMARLA